MNSDLKNKDYESLKCIWMSSDLVSYKLCDMNFDCDNCEFDKTIRNLSGKFEIKKDVDENIIDRKLKVLDNLNLSDQYIYLKNHLVLKSLAGDTYYLGLTRFAHLLIDQFDDYVIKNNNRLLNKGDEMILFKGKWGAFSIKSPAKMVLFDNIDPTKKALQRNGWLSMIGANKDELMEEQMSDEEFNTQKNMMRDYLNTISASMQSARTTLQDGGIKISYFYQLIGVKNYNSLLTKYFK